MKLVSYDRGGAPRAGVWIDGWIADLEKAAKASGVGALPTSVKAILEAGEPMLARARKVEAKAAKIVEAMTNGKQRRPAWLSFDEDVHLAPPVPDPGKILCLGLNYVDHCREQEGKFGRSVEPPPNPIIFAKFPSALIGPNDPIRLPPAKVASQIDFEVELALVIGRTARRLTQKDAMAHVAGFMVMNDVSARDVQFADKQWVRAKSFDTFAPCGPWLATVDEVDDPQRLDLWSVLNGETMQDGNTRNMIFKLARILAFITQAITLNPGDVIITGTPAGVGIFREPPRLLQPGDVIECGIQHLGTLCNPVERS